MLQARLCSVLFGVFAVAGCGNEQRPAPAPSQPAAVAPAPATPLTVQQPDSPPPKQEPVSVAPAVPVVQPDPNAPATELQGSWMVTAANLGGKEVTEEQNKKMSRLRYNFEGNRLSIGFPEEMESFLVEIDANATPKRVKLIPPGRPSDIQNAIYELDGDKLRICFMLSTLNNINGEYPTEFKGQQSPFVTDFMTMKRVNETSAERKRAE